MLADGVPLRVMVVDDHALVRAAIRQAISSHGDRGRRRGGDRRGGARDGTRGQAGRPPAGPRAARPQRAPGPPRAARPAPRHADRRAHRLGLAPRRPRGGPVRCRGLPDQGPRPARPCSGRSTASATGSWPCRAASPRRRSGSCARTGSGPDHGSGRLPDGPRGRGAAAGGRRPDGPADRGPPRRVQANGRGARRPHPPQARGAEPRPGGGAVRGVLSRRAPARRLPTGSSVHATAVCGSGVRSPPDAPTAALSRLEAVDSSHLHALDAIEGR